MPTDWDGMWFCLSVTSCLLLGDVLVYPVQDDIRDLEVVRTQHHHVGRAVEGAVEARVVELDILRLRGAEPHRPPRIDRLHGGLDTALVTV